MRYRSQAGREAGFSMIEVLIAAALLLFIALGLVPLFARSIVNNATGSDYSQATNGNRSRVEETLQIPFNSQILNLPTGETEVETYDFWAKGNSEKVGDSYEGWWPSADETPPSDKGQVLWQRRVVTHQYNMNSFAKDDLVLTEDEQEPGVPEREPGVPEYSPFIHLKEIEVILESERSDALGGGRRVAFRVLKPF
jgi:hypothetical protein